MLPDAQVVCVVPKNLEPFPAMTPEGGAPVPRDGDIRMWFEPRLKRMVN